jgi:hypothetical protein
LWLWGWCSIMRAAQSRSDAILVEKMKVVHKPRASEEIIFEDV